MANATRVHGAIKVEPDIIDLGTSSTTTFNVTFDGWSDCARGSIQATLFITMFRGPANLTYHPGEYAVAYTPVEGAVPPRMLAHANFVVHVNRTERALGLAINETNTWAASLGGQCELPPMALSDLQVTGNVSEFRVVGVAAAPMASPETDTRPAPASLALPLAAVGGLLLRRRRASM
jgi:hypothetical protein